jgi:hypothetical protein
VAGDAHGAHLALLLGPREGLHRAGVALRPVGLGHKVQQDDVDHVGAQFPQEALHVPRDLLGAPGRGLGGDHHFIAGQTGERFCDVRVRAVRVGRVPKVDAVVVCQPQQPRQSVYSQVGLF